MQTATDELRKTHKVVRKVLKELNVGGSRFTDVLKTLHRTVAAHAFFVDEIFIPALKDVPLIDSAFTKTITNEHKDIDRLIKLTRKTPLSRNKALDAYVLQIQTLIEANFIKECEALYILAEELLPKEKLESIASQMEKRMEELRDLVEE